MKIKQKKDSQPQSIMPTINALLIDGESLLKQGFHGTKQIQTEAGSSGAIFHFFNVIKMFYTKHFVTKVVVFWEGEDSRKYRQTYYPYYKSQRNDRYTTADLDDLSHKRIRIKEYLEELYIRQIEVDGCEADDAIAHYVVNSPNELKIIYTADRDLLQLISPYTRVYLSDKKAMISEVNFTNYFPYHRGNVGLIKMLAGDVSDNISGLQGIGEGLVLELFPELKTEEKNVEWILDRTRELIKDKPKSVRLQTILEGKSKWGTDGRDYYNVMDKIINLKNPHVTSELIDTILEAVNDPLDPEGRGGITKISTMIKEDHLLNLFPKYDDSYLGFWMPFNTIIQKEQNLFNKSK